MRLDDIAEAAALAQLDALEYCEDRFYDNFEEYRENLFVSLLTIYTEAE